MKMKKRRSETYCYVLRRTFRRVTPLDTPEIQGIPQGINETLNGNNIGEFMYEILALSLFIIVIMVLAYVFYLRREKSVLLREIEVRAEKRFMEMRDELKKVVLEKSRAALKGRIDEQIAPFLEQLKYNPADARFIGSPIDYVIFDGYTDVKDRSLEQPITVVLADIKTGKSASLTRVQKRIKRAIEEKRVKWETITLQ
jgi:predicted Holliday junction resolvase-like endonuclease